MAAPVAREARGWVGIATAAAFFVLWQLCSTLELINPVLLSSPWQIATSGYRLLASGALVADVLFTLGVYLLGLVLAGVIGTSVGILLGFSAPARDALEPFVVVANALPKVVLMPLIVLWLGVGFSANVFLATLMGSFPIILSVRAGVRSLDREYVWLARAYRASRYRMLRAVVLPGAAPFALSGLRVAVSYVMVGTIIAEFFASSAGLGYRMVVYMANFRVSEFFVCLTMVAALTLCFSALAAGSSGALRAGG